MKELLKNATSVRLSDETRQLLVKLSQKWGISQADVYELTFAVWPNKRG